MCLRYGGPDRRGRGKKVVLGVKEFTCCTALDAFLLHVIPFFCSHDLVGGQYVSSLACGQYVSSGFSWWAVRQFMILACGQYVSSRDWH